MSLESSNDQPNSLQTNNHTTSDRNRHKKTTHMLLLDEKRRGGYWFRKWDSLDIRTVSWLIATHVLACCAPFMFDWGALRVAGHITLLSGIGISLGYHRLLTHHSLKIPKWLEYFFAYCGAHAGLRDPIFWVSIHKNHHKYSDTDRDPHSPVEGFWFSHIGWLCYNDYSASKCGESRSGEFSNVPELKAQWFYRFLHETYMGHLLGLSALLYLYGGLPYLAWGMGMRIVASFHVSLGIASICHSWGERPWNTPDTSTNNWLLALLTFGEGWHNNHHAFPKSARAGLEWWQLDTTWLVIRFLELVGLATNVKSPTQDEKRKKALLFSSKPPTKKEDSLWTWIKMVKPTSGFHFGSN
uniref:delta-9 acyl-lipid desaturase 1-like n=1 Tax=Erigeron canadensis TaxID=72917 RepID=UPI001CB8C9AF|nr:delta-9 acyl-lipid desaturase 1-like [Erigeron canadensis]